MRNHPPLHADQLSEREDILVFVGLAVVRFALDAAAADPLDPHAADASAKIIAAYRTLATKNDLDPGPDPTAKDIEAIQERLSGKAMNRYDEQEPPTTDAFLWGRVEKENP